MHQAGFSFRNPSEDLPIEWIHGQLDTHEQIRGLLGRIAGPELYRNNPFRRLGLSVLASPREVAKRCDQLKMSSELGLSDSTRAFAPVHPPSVDEVREAAQQLQDPTQRLLLEFFWFWPMQYPEGGEDAGLAALEKGDAEEAFSVWCRGVAQSSPAALHNMAVYFHLTALDWEHDDIGSELSDAEMWEPALRYWKRILGNAAVWSCMEQRTKSLVAASMHGDFAHGLQACLAGALAGVNAQWAQIHAEKGLFQRALQHSEWVLGTHDNQSEGRRLLESCAAPAVRRIDARVADCQRQVEADTASALPEVIALLVTCDPEVRIIESFCGAGSARAREFCQSLYAGVLDSLVAYQRKTQDNRGCLPLLLHLLDRHATPELHQRVSEAFDVILGNALGGGGTDAFCRLLAGFLLPSERILNFNTHARRPYRLRLGLLLDRLSTQLRGNPLAPNIGSRALASASTLLGPTPQSSFSIAASSCTLEISEAGITLNAHTVPLSEVVGLRHGIAASGTPVIAWSSFSEAWELDLHAFGARQEDLLPLFASIVFALDHFVRPVLVQTMLGWLRTGEELVVGDLRLRRDGLRLADTAQSERMPLARLMAGQDATTLHISTQGPRPFAHTLDCCSTWNAVVLAQVIDTLAGDVETSANDRARIPSPGTGA